jgi:hypothetical protein
MLERYTPLTLSEVLKSGSEKTHHHADDLERSDEVTSEDQGEISGRGQDFRHELESDFEDVEVSSVIYVGRGSFRMEVTPEPVRLGVVQPVPEIVTAPLHAKPRKGSDGNAGPPRPRSLFGSHVDVPLLAAPMGAPGLHAAGVSLSRATLATLCGALLLCGIVVGTAARHLWSPPATTIPVTAAPATTAPVTTVPVAASPVASVAIEPVAAPHALGVGPAAPAAPAVVPATAAIRARPRPAAKPAAPAQKPAAATPAKPWVDPWAS